MSHTFVPHRLDLQAFAQAGASLSAQAPLSQFPRLLEEAAGGGAERHVSWEAQGALRQDAAGADQVWLHLRAQVDLPLICQRCLGPVDVSLQVHQSFRFVATEAQAEAEDDEAEEDVLALSHDFDLLALIEDELLMALPVVPRHETCPVPVRLAVQDADFEAAQASQPHPFAALAGLKGRKSD